MRSTLRALTAAVTTFSVLLIGVPADAAPQPPVAPGGQEASWLALSGAKRAARTPDGKVVLVARMKRPHDTGKVVRSASGVRGLKVRHTLPGAGTASFAVAAADATRARWELLSRPGVESVSFAVPRYFSNYVPNDPGFGDEQMGYYGNVHAPAGWDVSKGSADVKIAVIDSGVDTGHPDLAGKFGPGSTWNVVTSAFGVRDEIGHGTFVAGVAAAASDNATGVTGAGFDTSLIAVKVADSEGAVQSDSIAAAIVWAADHDADVINLSLGSNVPDPGEAAAVAYAQRRGVLVIAAAGNDGIEAKSYPAAYPGVIAVGATTGQGTAPKRAAFSQHGPWLTVGAPGENIYSTTPQVASEFFAANYDAAAGTSFSSPLTAGLAALLMAANPGATAAQVKEAITDGAEQVEGLDLGAGEIDFAASFPHLPPASAPTLTAGPVSGVLSLRATSTAAKVRFYADGKPLGAPVGVVRGGARSQPWDTFGLANGAHPVKAVDCTVHGECSRTGDEGVVTVDNGVAKFTAPANPAAPVAGNVRLTVTARSPKVRFYRGTAALGSPVAVAGGSASITTSTFGLANGATTFAARQCSARDVCAPRRTAVSLTVRNTVTALIAPVARAKVGGRVPVTASAPGGGVGFYVDGVRRAFDGAAPYRTSINFSALPAGPRSVTVRGCSSDGRRCSGPVSAAVRVTNTSLRPAVSTRSPFSPDGDGVRDVLGYTVTVPGSQKASVRIVGPSGNVVQGPRNLGTLSAGAHAFTWRGLTKSGAALPDGRYVIEVTTATGSGGTARAGWAARAARLDTRAPALSALSGTASTFYPYRDGYGDTFTPRVTLSEPARLQLIVRNAAGRVVHHGADVRLLGGRRSLTWPGRINGGAIAPAGSYTFALIATDAAGNRRGTMRQPVKVSAKRLVDRVATVEVDAARYTNVAISGCGDADSSVSKFEGGVVLLTSPCGDVAKANTVRVDYQLSLPKAAVYRSLTVEHAGYAGMSAMPIYGFVRDQKTGKLDAVGSVNVTAGEPMPRSHRPIAAGQHVNGGRIEVGIQMSDTASGLLVYDVAMVAVTVEYAVLV